MKRITVLLADDSEPLRAEIRKTLEREADLDVLGEANNGHEAVLMASGLRPSVILMDFEMPFMNGVEATRRILEFAPATKIIMHSAHGEEPYVEAAINAGAVGYLVKPAATDSLGKAIREASRGNTFFSPSISKNIQRKSPKTSGT